MKKYVSILITLALVAIVVPANAQSVSATDVIKKGSYNLSPQLLNVGFNSFSFGTDMKDSEDTKITQFGLALAGGYALADGLTLNGQLGAQYLKLEDTKILGATLGANVRYYFPMNLFIGAGANFNYASLKGMSFEGYEAESENYNFVDVTAMVGYAIFITPKIALEPSVSYRHKVAGGKIEDTNHSITYNGFGLNLGVSIFF